LYNKLALEIEENHSLIDKDKRSNFFQRTFSQYNKKQGIDLYPYIALV
jgi:hypothetical protein